MLAVTPRLKITWEDEEFIEVPEEMGVRGHQRAVKSRLKILPKNH